MRGPEAELQALLELLRQRTGLAIPAVRLPTATEAIEEVMTQLGFADLPSFRHALAQDRTPWGPLLDRLTVGETYFFRDPAHFWFVRDQVLPALPPRRVRAWSAGCASGEEAYSLAMLLVDCGRAGAAQVLGTDLSPAALERARRGCYRPFSLRGSGKVAARPHLRHDGTLFCVEERVKRLVTFAELNLLGGPYPDGPFDVIFCRNVLLYLAPEAIEEVARRLFAALAPGGWLLTGPSDPPLGEPFELVVTAEGLLYRRPERPERPFPPSPPPPPSAVKPKSKRLRPATLPRPPRPARRPVEDLVDRRRQLAEEALARGDYERAAQLTANRDDPRALALHIRARANLDGSETALGLVTAAARRHPLLTELHYLQSTLLMGVGRLEEAISAARRVVYLAPANPVAHLLLGMLLRRRGERAAARRSFRAAQQLLSRCEPDARFPLADQESVAGLSATAARALSALDGEATPVP